ncbi:MAG: electron transfer flavoprotein subunit alpha/FixB family protein [Spirochaetales bacterium]|jgi:electron transfer flavoprotein alpha subunit|nr:electron transfer flavoprotein subunit alpha/FixB family protein [Spirochaetales bacterium]
MDRINEKHSVMVYIQENQGKIHPSSLELLSQGRELAKVLEAPVTAVILGSRVREHLNTLGEHGADGVYYQEDPRLEVYGALPYVKILDRAVEQLEPEILLFGATLQGRDLAPRLAARRRVGLSADCTGLSLAPYEGGGPILFQTKPAFGGNILAEIVSPRTRPQMSSVRQGVFPLGPPLPGRKPAVIRDLGVPLDLGDFALTLLESLPLPRRNGLEGAGIVVAGGMGFQNARDFELVYRLAEVLKGEAAGTRPAVDAGFIEEGRMVGQTGLTVRPRLYFACGISGALQHRVGMEQAERIVAINTDPQAPVFQLAHYGIVGDVKTLIPRLIRIFSEAPQEEK